MPPFLLPSFALRSGLTGRFSSKLSGSIKKSNFMTPFLHCIGYHYCNFNMPTFLPKRKKVVLGLDNLRKVYKTAPVHFGQKGFLCDSCLPAGCQTWRGRACCGKISGVHSGPYFKGSSLQPQIHCQFSADPRIPGLYSCQINQYWSPTILNPPSITG